MRPHVARRKPSHPEPRSTVQKRAVHNMPRSHPQSEAALPLTALDLQVLLVLAGRDLYGYAIKKAVERESGGILSPEIGSLYRVMARLMDSGWVEEADSREPGSEPHRGRPRKYYRITPNGVEVARAEVRRLRRVVEAAAGLAPEVVR